MMAPTYVWSGECWGGRPSLLARWRLWATGLAIGAVGFVAACASSDLPPTLQVYQLQGQLDAAIEEVELYAAQPPCNPELGIVVLCHDPAALAAAVDAAIEADTALDDAELVVRAGGTTQEITLYVNIARLALSRIALALAQE